MLGLLRRGSQVRAKHAVKLSRPLSEWAFPSEWEAKALKEAKKVCILVWFVSCLSNLTLT